MGHPAILKMQEPGSRYAYIEDPNGDLDRTRPVRVSAERSKVPAVDGRAWWERGQRTRNPNRNGLRAPLGQDPPPR